MLLKPVLPSALRGHAIVSTAAAPRPFQCIRSAPAEELPLHTAAVFGSLYLQGIMNEVELLKNLNHRNIVK